uniref:Uncharacterized protein n=1 Tax=Knipowitschia caucasica TaxID=637954 RepID=A0AAV2KAX6_KNICA
MHPATPLIPAIWSPSKHARHREILHLHVGEQGAVRLQEDGRKVAWSWGECVRQVDRRKQRPQPDTPSVLSPGCFWHGYRNHEDKSHQCAVSRGSEDFSEIAAVTAGAERFAKYETDT